MKTTTEVEENGTLGSLGLAECMLRLASTMPLTLFIVYFDLLFLLFLPSYLVVTVCIDFCPVKYYVIKLFNKLKMPGIQFNKNHKISHVN